MPKFQVGVTISKPIKTVYEAYINPDNMLQWTKDLEKVEIVKGKFGEIGATAQLYYNQKGRKSILIDKLKYIEPGRKLISQVSGGGITAEVETLFNSLNGGTELKLIWDGTGKNLLVKIFLSIMRNKIRKSAEAELNLFKELVETFGSKFKIIETAYNNKG